MPSHPCFGLKENDREASCITDEKNYILLRLNYIQRWNVCQKALKILCLHSVYSLETRKIILLFSVGSSFQKMRAVWHISGIVPLWCHKRSFGFIQVSGLFLFFYLYYRFFFLHLIVLTSEKKLFEIWAGREALNVSIIDTDEAVPPKWGRQVPVGCPIYHAVKVTIFTFSWYNLFAFIFCAPSLVKFPSNKDKNLF